MLAFGTGRERTLSDGMRIATFNVNGVNGRLPVLLEWLAEAKPELLRMLAPGAGEKPEDDGRRFDARPSRRPGYTSLNGPIE